MAPVPSSLEILTDPARAAVALDPERARLLAALRERSDSAAGLARRLGESRQRLNYHLRSLEAAGLVELEAERRRGNCVERVLKPAAGHWLLDPSMLGGPYEEPTADRDRFSATYLIALAARASMAVPGLFAPVVLDGRILVVLGRVYIAPERPEAGIPVEVLDHGDGRRGAAARAQLQAGADEMGGAMSKLEMVRELNTIGGRNGVGRIDIVENRFVGIKSRGVYETPGGTVLHAARRAVESIVLDREVLHMRESLAQQYARIVYNGFWYSPERTTLQATMDRIQAPVTGEARLILYKGSVRIAGRRSPNSIYDADVATFEADDVYDQSDATGFIRLRALRLRTLGARRISEGE